MCIRDRVKRRHVHFIIKDDIDDIGHNHTKDEFFFFSSQNSGRLPIKGHPSLGFAVSVDLCFIIVRELKAI